jgi:adenylate kinase family enzyme
MEYKFSIQIDDDKHTLSSYNGISIKYLWELLRDLYKSIETDEEGKCTLSGVRGNCYALDFTTEEKQYEENFIRVHKNIEELSSSELQPEEKNYARTLKKILGGKYYLRAYDNEHNIIATIKELDKEKSINQYYSYKTIYGIVTELGAKSLNAEKKHIRIDGFPHNISISKDLDMELKKYYGTQKLKIDIKVKLSYETNRIISAEMRGFIEVSSNKLSQNLKEIGYVDFELIKNANTVNDIIDKIYGNNE